MLARTMVEWARRLMEARKRGIRIRVQENPAGILGNVQQQGQRQEGGKFKGNKKNFFTQQSGQGSTGQSSRPPQQQGAQNYRGPQNAGGSGQRGRGKTNQKRPRVAVMATSEELRGMADQMDREEAQHVSVSDEDASLWQRQGN